MKELESIFAVHAVMDHPATSIWRHEIGLIAEDNLTKLGRSNLRRIHDMIDHHNGSMPSEKSRCIIDYLSGLAESCMDKPALPFMRDDSYVKGGDKVIVYFPYGSDKEEIPGRTFIEDAKVAGNRGSDFLVDIEGVKENKLFLKSCPYILTEPDFFYLTSGMDIIYTNRWLQAQEKMIFPIENFTIDMLKQIRNPELYSLRPEDLND